MMSRGGKGKRREKHSPATLKHITANQIVETLFHTTRNLHSIIELSKSSLSPYDKSAITAENSNANNENTGINTHHFSSAKDNQYQTCAEAAQRVFHVRQFVDTKIPKEIRPILLQHTIAKAMETKDIPLVRLAVSRATEILDFRAQDYYLHRSVVPHSVSRACTAPKLKVPAIPLSATSSNSSLASVSRGHQHHYHPHHHQNAILSAENSRSGTYLKSRSDYPVVPKWAPPDEHDWFSRDKIGKIVSFSEACELFSITTMSQCASSLKEFYINARRSKYWAASKEIMPVVTDALRLFTRLTTLVLRGMTDDFMLQIIGESCNVLQHFDVSGSKFVTDDGIRNLFFKDLKQNSSLYMIGSWVMKNLDKLHPVANTLEHLDCSWTSVTVVSRKIIGIIPGSYMFRRFFAKTEEEAYGQHIFIRKPPDFTNKIQPKLGKDWSVSFEAQLQCFTGPKGLKGMCKFLEVHPWNNCMMNLFVHDDTIVHGGNHLEDNPTCSGLVTPNSTERRIYGGFTFFCGNVTELYSIFPLNVNLVGECFPKLKVLRGTMTDQWKMKCSLLPELTDVEIFASPLTAVSIFEFCPNMKVVKLRIVKSALCDDHILKSIPNSMCSRTLEELWIAPGIYKSVGEENNFEYDSSGVLESSESSDAMLGQQRNSLGGMSNFFGLDATHKHQNASLEDFVHLSLESLVALIRDCKKLRRLGDISWWNLISQHELFQFCEVLKTENTVMALIWENTILPEY